MIAKVLVGIAPKIWKEIQHGGLNTPVAICSFLSICSVPCCNANNQPEQLHISSTGDVTQMAVMFATLNPTTTSIVWYGTDPTALNMNVTASPSTYTHGGWIGVLHTAIIPSLQPSTGYSYQVETDSGLKSTVRTFSTLSDTLESPLRLAVVGDMVKRIATAHRNEHEQAVKCNKDKCGTS